MCGWLLHGVVLVFGSSFGCGSVDEDGGGREVKYARK